MHVLTIVIIFILDCEQHEEVGTDSDDEDDTAADQQEPLKLKTYKEAVIVSQFLEYKGHGDEALSIGCTIDRIVNLKHMHQDRQHYMTILLANNDRHIRINFDSFIHIILYNM